MAKVLMMYMQVVLAVAGETQDWSGWISKDIGKIAVPGTATYNEEGMVWTVRGEGIDIHGGADSFQYVHAPLGGDGVIVAKVESVGKTDVWAKCGVMIRESIEPRSRFAAVYATPANGVAFQIRGSTAGPVVTDTSVRTKEQRALRAPVWIKLERKGSQFCGYYATDEAGMAWTPMAWKPPTIPMARTVHAGLAVCSHAAGVLCEARFSNVVVFGTGAEIMDVDVSANPKEALAKAYQNLERLGNWRDNRETIKNQGNLIAGSLFVIARARELRGEPASTVLPDYYRITELLPMSPFVTDALAQIAILDGEKGPEYATRCLDSRPAEDKDRFYAAVIKDCCSKPRTPADEVILPSFVEYVATHSRFTLLEQVIADLGSDARSILVCKSLIQYGMAQPSHVQMAVVSLRYLALQTHKRKDDSSFQELLMWAATQFQDTKLGPYATAALADLFYEQGSYTKAIETFQPGLFSANHPEDKLVEHIESTLASYRAKTLLPATVNPERVYKALGEQAAESQQHIVNLHCQRRIAELRGLSLEDFERSALRGLKRCESGPENEVWFWKGLLMAGEGDFDAALAAYERFLQGDGKSVLAARAYYDIARAKMALGEDARAWITKAKALSPCEAVLQLEKRLDPKVPMRG
jgi:tetratricopeptide (TPR) repeat protein